MRTALFAVAVTALLGCQSGGWGVGATQSPHTSAIAPSQVPDIVTASRLAHAPDANETHIAASRRDDLALITLREDGSTTTEGLRIAGDADDATPPSTSWSAPTGGVWADGQIELFYVHSNDTYTDYTIHHLQRAPGAERWQRVHTIPDASWYDVAFDIPRGRVHLAYIERLGDTLLHTVFDRESQTWSTPQQIAEDILYPQIAVDGEGTPVFVAVESGFHLFALEPVSQQRQSFHHDAYSVDVATTRDGDIVVTYADSVGQLTLTTRDLDTKRWSPPLILLDGLDELNLIQALHVDGDAIRVLVGTEAISIPGASTLCALEPGDVWRCLPQRDWEVGGRARDFVDVSGEARLLYIDADNTLWLEEPEPP